MKTLVDDKIITQGELDRTESYEQICDLFLECAGVEAKSPEQWEAESKKKLGRKKK